MICKPQYESCQRIFLAKPWKFFSLQAFVQKCKRNNCLDFGDYVLYYLMHSAINVDDDDEYELDP